MKTLITTLAILIIAIITNPNTDKHREVVYRKLYTTYQKVESEPKKKLTNFEAGIKGISDIIIAKAMKNIVDEVITTDNCLLFSFTKFENKNGSKIIGIGVFGQVYIYPEIDQFWRDVLKEN